MPTYLDPPQCQFCLVPETWLIDCGGYLIPETIELRISGLVSSGSVDVNVAAFGDPPVYETVSAANAQTALRSLLHGRWLFAWDGVDRYTLSADGPAFLGRQIEIVTDSSTFNSEAVAAIPSFTQFELVPDCEARELAIYLSYISAPPIAFNETTDPVAVITLPDSDYDDGWPLTGGLTASVAWDTVTVSALAFILSGA